MNHAQQASLDLGHRAAQAAADHAGIEWQAAAFDAFVQYARQHETFTTEDVRMTADLPSPPDNRAWGAVAKRAQRANVIEHDGWTQAKNRNVHGSIISRWKSKTK